MRKIQSASGEDKRQAVLMALTVARQVLVWMDLKGKTRRPYTDFLKDCADIEHTIDHMNIESIFPGDLTVAQKNTTTLRQLKECKRLLVRTRLAWAAAYRGGMSELETFSLWKDGKDFLESKEDYHGK